MLLEDCKFQCLINKYLILSDKVVIVEEKLQGIDTDDIGNLEDLLTLDFPSMKNMEY